MLSFVILTIEFLDYSFSSDQIALFAFFVAVISAIISILQWRTAQKALGLEKQKLGFEKRKFDFEQQKLVPTTKVQFARFPDEGQLGIYFKKEVGESFTIKNNGNTDFRVSQVSFSQTDVKDRFGDPLHLTISHVDEKKIIKPEQTMDIQIPMDKLPNGKNLSVEVNVLSSEDEFTDLKIFKRDFYIPYTRY